MLLKSPPQKPSAKAKEREQALTKEWKEWEEWTEWKELEETTLYQEDWPEKRPVARSKPSGPGIPAAPKKGGAPVAKAIAANRPIPAAPPTVPSPPWKSDAMAPPIGPPPWKPAEAGPSVAKARNIAVLKPRSDARGSTELRPPAPQTQLRYVVLRTKTKAETLKAIPENPPTKPEPLVKAAVKPTPVAKAVEKAKAKPVLSPYAQSEFPGKGLQVPNRTAPPAPRGTQSSLR